MLNKYIYTTFLYSGIRKLIYTYDTKYREHINHEIVERPILYTHHLSHFLFAGISGIGLAPIHLFHDISMFEMKLRNIQPLPDSKNSKLYDVDFMSVMLDLHIQN